MSYKITVRVYQRDPNSFFHIAEYGVLVGGTWSEYKGEHIVEFISSGTSGTLRFVSDTNENFIVVLGVHNYKRWCDIVTNLPNNQTGVTLNPQYYTGNRGAQREKQLASYSVKNSNGRQFSVEFTRADGQDLACNVIIDSLNAIAPTPTPVPVPVTPVPAPTPAPVVPVPTPEPPRPTLPIPTPEVPAPTPAPVVPVPTPEPPRPTLPVPTPEVPVPTPEPPRPVVPVPTPEPSHPTPTTTTDPTPPTVPEPTPTPVVPVPNKPDPTPTPVVPPVPTSPPTTNPTTTAPDPTPAPVTPSVPTSPPTTNPTTTAPDPTPAPVTPSVPTTPPTTTNPTVPPTTTIPPTTTTPIPPTPTPTPAPAPAPVTPHHSLYYPSLTNTSNQWIWTPEVQSTLFHHPAQATAGTSRAFRRTINTGKPVDAMVMTISADDMYTVYVNGKVVGCGSDWMQPDGWSIKFSQPTDKVVIAIFASQAASKTDVGFAFSGVLYDSMSDTAAIHAVTVKADAEWLCFPHDNVGVEFIKPAFDDSKWVKSFVQNSAYRAKDVKSVKAGKRRGEGIVGSGSIPSAPRAEPAEVLEV